MIWIGIDAHKRVHQAVALGVDGVLGQKVIANTPAGCTELVRWANAWPERVWAIEGSGSLRRGVAQFLASRGERVHEVNPRWTAQHRRGLRRPGKSGRKHDIPAPTRGPCSCGTPRLSAHLRASAPAERGDFRQAEHVLFRWHAARYGAARLRHRGLCHCRPGARDRHRADREPRRRSRLRADRDSRCVRVGRTGCARAVAGQHWLFPLLAHHRRRHILSLAARCGRSSTLIAPSAAPDGARLAQRLANAYPRASGGYTTTAVCIGTNARTVARREPAVQIMPRASSRSTPAHPRIANLSQSPGVTESTTLDHRI